MNLKKKKKKISISIYTYFFFLEKDIAESSSELTSARQNSIV